jgi:cysteine desulfurase
VFVVGNSAVRHEDTNIHPAPDGSDRLMPAGSDRPVYLDCCATAPPIPAVIDEVHRFLAVDFGNAGSRTHEYGNLARRRVNLARDEVAALAAAEPDEVVFTGGATEANNLAILGLADALAQRGRRHVVTSALEHKAVLEPIAMLEQRRFEVSRIAADERGLVDPEELLAAIGPQTGLVSVMHVNNETGVIQPLAAIAERLPEEAFFHVDAAQGLGKELQEIAHERIDLISGSAHKLHGPKGVGALIARKRGFTRAPLQPLMVGGGQERGLRPGTIATHLVAGFGTAARAAIEEHAERRRLNEAFRERALAALRPLAPVINGDPARALPNVLNVSLLGIDAEAAIVATKDLIRVSNGSACTSHRYEPSHVLTAMGLPPKRAASALRISWCHLTPEPDWAAVVRRLGVLRG